MRSKPVCDSTRLVGSGATLIIGGHPISQGHLSYVFLNARLLQPID